MTRLFLMLAVTIGIAFPVAADDCISMMGTTLFDTSNNCSSEPGIDRVLGSTIIKWNGRDFLFVNIGNEIKIWSIDNPQSPVSVDTSDFNVPNQGDSDYDLMAFTVCDDCRYGAAWYKMGTVIFELGTGPRPRFDDDNLVLGATFTFGGVAFKHNDNDYLVTTSGVGNSCEGTATLFEVNGVQESSLSNIGCVRTDTRPVLAGGGRYVDGYLYLGDSSTRVFLFEVQTFGNAISLNYLSEPMRANFGRDAGLGFDIEVGVLVEANNTGVAIWDISNPGNPIEKGGFSGNYSRATVAYPLMFVSLGGVPNTEETYDISNLNNPVALSQSFWNESNSWNYPGHNCTATQSADLAPDGTVLFINRYSRLQMADMTACTGPVSPTAKVTLNRVSVFPSEQVTASNGSIGDVDRHAIWVNTSATPHGSAAIAGSETLSALTSDNLQFTVPIDLASGVRYWAHVAAESNEFPYQTNGTTPDQVASIEINLDREPGVTLDLFPLSPITGDDLTVTANAEGTPLDPDQGASYEWTVTDAQLAETQYTGTSIDLSLAETGEWIVDLVVHYSHQTVTGAPYDAVAAETLNISSVSANFTVTPSGLLNTDPIFLNASSSSIAAGSNVSYQWRVSGATIYYGCPDSATCTIQADTLNPGNHAIELTLTNTDNDDVSVLSKNVAVEDGTIQLDFSISPSSPDVGDTITFRIEGTSAALTTATWNFGGSACSGSGYSSPVTCNAATDFFECTVQPYAYATSGTKTVSLSVNIGGSTFGPTSKQISVGSGNCSGGGGGGGGGGGTCSYSINPGTSNFSSTGGTGNVTVSTSAGCAWNASSSAGWASITSGSSGSGSGSVRYNVAAYTGTDDRATTLSIAGKYHFVNQSAQACVATLGCFGNWEPVANAGVGNVQNTAASAMAVFENHIYVGTKNEASGFEVLRTADGMFWQLVASGGLGDPGNTRVTAFEVFSNNLYLATANGISGCEIWRSTGGTAWSKTGLDGFGTANNTEAPAMAAFAGDLYAGTTNLMSGAKIWRTIGTQFWTQVSNGGFGDSENASVTTLQGFSSKLYAGSTGFWGFRLFRRTDGVSWEQIGLDGFGDNTNVRITALKDVGGSLLLGTRNDLTGGEIWASGDGSSWQQVNLDGFDGQHVNQAVSFLQQIDNVTTAGVSNPQAGGAVWTNTAPSTWQKVSPDGFGDQYNVDLPGAVVFNGMMYVGTENPFGFQIWRLNPNLLFRDGFEAGTASDWTVSSP